MMSRHGLSLLIALLLSPGLSRGAVPRRAEIDPRADRELRRMSDYLSNLKSFRVRADSVDEVVLTSGEKLQLVAESEIAVKRPNRLLSMRVGPVANVVFRYDGRSISLFGQKTGYYALAPAPPTIDQAIDQARSQYGLEAPGADLLMSRPYDVLMDGVSGATYVGLEPIEGTPCHHLAFVGAEADWQIWIQDGREPVPRRYVITSKKVTGQPEFTVRMSRWESRAPISDAEFVFRPPPGAKRIRFFSERSAPAR
jgi:hypothetical protein